MKQKIYKDTDAIIADVPDGARIMFGRFGGAGFPNNLIQALARRGTKNITAISNSNGVEYSSSVVGCGFRLWSVS